MFDIRYHALSLAAVFIALVVGLLLGAAIGDNSIFTTAERAKAARLTGELTATQASNSKLASDLALRERYEADVFPAVVANELVGERIGLVFLGQDNNQIDQFVRAAIAPAGAVVAYDAVLREPLELTSLAAASAPSRYSALASDPALLGPFARAVGGQLVYGGALVRRLEPSLFSSYAGTLGPVAAVVIVRDDPSLPASVRTQTATFEDNLAAGLAATRLPVVGVELTDTTPSQIGWYDLQQLASVDDIDDIAGRTALVYSLAGAHGAYGLLPTAQALLPATVATGTPAGR
ncbi:MAG: copper transporter [Solirubrobacteraceae bacterium]|jgi:hypothetical protein